MSCLYIYLFNDEKKLPSVCVCYFRYHVYINIYITLSSIIIFSHHSIRFDTIRFRRLLVFFLNICSTVAVPNSLGPGELLARYGTPDQKEYFLPRLADGTLIPCFGLTGPHAGSDATSLIESDCVVEERNGELGVVASFKKRYITLAPVAGVIGLGLNLSDPKGLLKGNGAEGFTVALLE